MIDIQYLEEDIGSDEKVVRVGRAHLVRPVHEGAVVELEQHDDMDGVDALVLRQHLDLDVCVVVVLYKKTIYIDKHAGNN